MPYDASDDHRPVSGGPDEIDSLLHRWRKANSDANRRLLADAVARFLTDPEWDPHSRERFHQYADARGVKQKLTDGPPPPADEHPYTVIREWRETAPGEKPVQSVPSPAKPPPAPPPSPETELETETLEPVTPAPSPAPEKETPASPTPTEAAALEAIATETATTQQGTAHPPPPPTGRNRKRRPPAFFIIWGLALAAAVIVILLLVKRGVDASSVQAPEFIFNQRTEETQTPPPGREQTDGGRTTPTPAERFTQTVKENSPVLFFADQEIWLPGEGAKLDRIVDALPEIRAATLTVTGHTADAGKPNAQFVLSAERANAVRAYLLQHKGTTELNITIIGRGANDPVVTGAPGGPPVPLSEQGANRRAEIRVDKAE